jgi:hypothetical protein
MYGKLYTDFKRQQFRELFLKAITFIRYTNPNSYPSDQSRIQMRFFSRVFFLKFIGNFNNCTIKITQLY